jgi:hypothetical protein
MNPFDSGDFTNPRFVHIKSARLTAEQNTFNSLILALGNDEGVRSQPF